MTMENIKMKNFFTKDLLIMLLLLIAGLQGGYLIKSYIDFIYGPAPLVTPNDLVLMVEEK